MEEKDKPITDKENFPPTSGPNDVTVVPLAQMAYTDGCADGYRRAVIEIAVLIIMGVMCLRLAQSLSR